MNDKTKRVIAGWLALSDSERADFEAEINRVRNAPSWQQRSIREELTNVVTKVATGPYGQGCPCCGR
jgi:hypothetical protein